MRRLLYCLVLLPLLAGCTTSPNAEDISPPPAVARVNEDRSAGAFADTDPWLLKSTDVAASRANHGIFLGNGFIGTTFGATGAADTKSVVYLAGLYDKNEVLQKLPNWHDLGLPEPKPGEPYEQTLDLKQGILTTKMGPVTVTSFVSAINPSLAGIRVTGLTVKPSLPSSGGLPGTFSARYQDKPETDGFSRLVMLQNRSSETPAFPASFEAALTAHQQVWQKRWQDADIQIDGDPEAQQLVHKLMFDLLQSAHPEQPFSIAPESLSGEFYKGHIFWDAEIWMLPALLPQYPERARAMLEYRFSKREAAQAQAKAQKCRGMDFPWESAVTGKETAPSGFSQGRHVTAGIGWAAWQYYRATGDKKWLAERGIPLLSGIADYFASRATKNATTGKYEIRNVYGPDENKGTCNNNTYTNAMAQNVLRYATEAAKQLGRPANPQWKTVADNLVLPFDQTANRYLARDDDKGEKTKQADGELLIYPAQLPMGKEVVEATFDFHKERPIATGPAMTDSIHALIAARLGRAEEAEKDFRASYRPFVRGPFVLFSEKRTLDRCVFTTGAGGVLQSILYGFGGLDWSSPDGTINAPVALPPSWKSLTITGIQRAGKRYTLTVTPSGRTLTPLAAR